MNHEVGEFSKKLIQAAPEPNDVQWGNIDVGRGKQIKNGVLIILATIVLMIACYISVYLIKKLQNYIKDIHIGQNEIVKEQRK